MTSAEEMRTILSHRDNAAIKLRSIANEMADVAKRTRGLNETEAWLIEHVSRTVFDVADGLDRWTRNERERLDGPQSLRVPEALAYVLATDYFVPDAETNSVAAKEAVLSGVDFDWDLISEEELKWFGIFGLWDRVPEWVKERYETTPEAEWAGR